MQYNKSPFTALSLHRGVGGSWQKALVDQSDPTRALLWSQEKGCAVHSMTAGLPQVGPSLPMATTLSPQAYRKGQILYAGEEGYCRKTFEDVANRGAGTLLWAGATYPHYPTLVGDTLACGQVAKIDATESDKPHLWRERDYTCSQVNVWTGEAQTVDIKLRAPNSALRNNNYVGTCLPGPAGLSVVISGQDDHQWRLEQWDLATATPIASYLLSAEPTAIGACHQGLLCGMPNGEFLYLEGGHIAKRWLAQVSHGSPARMLACASGSPLALGHYASGRLCVLEMTGEQRVAKVEYKGKAPSHALLNGSTAIFQTSDGLEILEIGEPLLQRHNPGVSFDL